ncbi:hypothetical protein V6N11_034753 [Hibiscus sabdariffa]|uniref:Uncharacterized protein n=1 Tax=Hibiscus sabdariffa TaxID=183260 RepID=A0ABR2NRQ5_9ROSI
MVRDNAASAGKSRLAGNMSDSAQLCHGRFTNSAPADAIVAALAGSECHQPGTASAVFVALGVIFGDSERGKGKGGRRSFDWQSWFTRFFLKELAVVDSTSRRIWFHFGYLGTDFGGKESKGG